MRSNNCVEVLELRRHAGGIFVVGELMLCSNFCLAWSSELFSDMATLIKIEQTNSLQDMS